jgi:hypothetical protein
MDEVSSDGFMINILDVLLLLSEVNLKKKGFLNR